MQAAAKGNASVRAAAAGVMARAYNHSAYPHERWRSVARQALAGWYSEHLAAAREVLRGHRCALELDIEDPCAAELLARRFPGTNASCWQKASLTSRRAAKGSTSARTEEPLEDPVDRQA